MAEQEGHHPGITFGWGYTPSFQDSCRLFPQNRWSS
ncbi:MAG: hypothetical protein OEX19_07970 [Gammaproteobacteria bacterium]|nr:hypothetical protein [Gammaproteobacteria bacterium]